MKKPIVKLWTSVAYTVAYTIMTVAVMWALVGLFNIDVHADDEKFAAIEMLDPNDKDEAVLIQQGIALREWSEQLKVKVYAYRVVSIVFCALTLLGVVLNARSVKKTLDMIKNNNTVADTATENKEEP